MSIKRNYRFFLLNFLVLPLLLFTDLALCAGPNSSSIALDENKLVFIDNQNVNIIKTLKVFDADLRITLCEVKWNYNNKAVAVLVVIGTKVFDLTCFKIDHSMNFSEIKFNHRLLYFNDHDRDINWQMNDISILRWNKLFDLNIKINYYGQVDENSYEASDVMCISFDENYLFKKIERVIKGEVIKNK